MAKGELAAILGKEGDGYVALCPESDVATLGKRIEEALADVREAVERFLECADPAEIQGCLRSEIITIRFEAVGG